MRSPAAAHAGKRSSENGAPPRRSDLIAQSLGQLLDLVFKVLNALNDGSKLIALTLNRSAHGLLLVKMTWKTRPLAAWQQADVPDVVSKSLIKPAIGDDMEALKIGIDAPEPVSGLLLNPPDARACFVFAHGAGAGMAHPFVNAVAAGRAVGPRRSAGLRRI
jgi:hypothetical protein